MMTIIEFVFSHPLTRQSKLRSFARILKWQVGCRLRREIIIPWISGTKLVASRGMTGATGNIYGGLHEFADMLFVLHFLRQGDLFLDVGANIGSYTVLASGVRGARTWAFEPDPVTAEALHKNVEVNDLSTLVNIYRLAVGSNCTDIRFTVGLDTTNRVALDGDRDFRIVPQRPLDDLLHGNKPIMMKMDIEGYEDEALAGAGSILSGNFLKAIQLETLSSESERMLRMYGFERVYYD